MRISSRPIALIIVGVALIGLALCLLAMGADAALLARLRWRGDGASLQAIRLLSDLGSAMVMIPVALMVASLWLRRRERGVAIWLVLTVGSGRALVELVKILVHRARPPLDGRLVAVSSWSFPSAHSAGTMLTCLGVGMLARRQGAGLVTAMLLGALIGWTRLALAVHWPSDVLAGWGSAMLWVGLAARIAPPRLPR